MTPTDETLMAFADGVLPAEEAAQLARAVAADPALAERLALLRGGREAVRGAFAATLAEPVPSRLLAAARNAPSVALPKPANDDAPLPRRAALRPALAAACALLGAVLGYGAARYGEAPGPGALGGALTAALEAAPSGGAGPLAVLATHRVEDGAVCRVFRAPDGAGSLAGVACRGPEGGWRLRVAVAREGGAGFAPASGDDPLIAEALERLGAGPALDPAEERRLLGR